MPEVPPPVPPAPKPLVPPPPPEIKAGAAVPPGADAPLPEEEQPLVLETSFWQHPFVQNVLPFLTSLTLHITLIAAGLLTVKAVQRIVDATQEQAIIPDSNIEDSGTPGGIPHPGLGGDASRDAAQNKFPDVPPDSKGWSDKPGPLEGAPMGGGAGDGDTGPGVIGAGGNRTGKGTGLGSGSGAGVGTGTGDGSGPLAPFGVPGGGGGLLPRSNFFGSGGNARKICYVCDASGSMMAKFDSLRGEISKSIANLKGTQSFNVVFFQQEKAAAFNEKSLQLANGETRDKSAKFLEGIVPMGETRPIPALETAFRQQPELIYLLTDGEFPNNEEVINWIRANNKDKKIKINTIAFVNRGDDYEKVLKTIASENGGLFKYVSEQELGQ